MSDTILQTVRNHDDWLRELRHRLHRMPELGLDTHRTADLVAEELTALGIEVHRGIGGAGVVGVLRGGASNRSVGLRADMDALAIPEETGKPWASDVPGMMHGCGHDGHIAMLLGAARYLAENGGFDGTVNLIFQPGEEGFDGAREMIRAGLFERFPCDSLFGMHNEPGLPVGRFRTAEGAIAAGGGNFTITVTGRGGHAAEPDRAIDPVLTACHIVTALQSVVSRSIAPIDSAVLSVTQVSGGDAFNVIPGTAKISGTARYFRPEVGRAMLAAMTRIAEGVAAGFGATAAMEFREMFVPHVNAPGPTAMMVTAAAAIGGDVATDMEPSLGSEDFSFMAERVPAAYMMLGNGDSAALHSPQYDFNDEALAHGAALYARLAIDATRRA